MATNELDMETETEEEMYPPRRTFAEQEYWCNVNTCGKRIRSTGIPIGWYIVRKAQASGTSMAKLNTVSILCSLECLIRDSMEEAFRRINRY